MSSPRTDHDQRFKTLLRTFFADFMRLFFQRWPDRMDLDNVGWENIELYPDQGDSFFHIGENGQRVLNRCERTYDDSDVKSLNN